MLQNTIKLEKTSQSQVNRKGADIAMFQFGIISMFNNSKENDGN